MSRTEVEIIRDNRIVTADLSDNCVTNGKLSTNSVSTIKIQNRSVTLEKLADNISFFPIGGIVMWNGTTSNVPSGWALCDGTNGTPDLRDRFIVGAGRNYNPNATGGADSVTLTVSQMPSHSHSMGSAGDHNHSGSSSGDGSHTHSGNTGGASANHHHGGTTDFQGEHAHDAPWFRGVGQGGATWAVANGSDNRRTNSAGTHGHNFTTLGHSNDHHHAVSISGGGHSHSISINGVGGHTHTLGNTGSSQPLENRPPYYALCFIMKT